jgi:hypothetical protein
MAVERKPDEAEEDEAEAGAVRIQDPQRVVQKRVRAAAQRLRNGTYYSGGVGRRGR